MFTLNGSNLHVCHLCFISAIPKSEICSNIQAKSSIAFIPSLQLSSNPCSTLHTFKIRAQPGQKVNLTAIGLHSGQNGGSHPFSLGYAVDDISHEQYPLIINGQSSPLIVSHSISLLLDNTYGQPPFVLGYKGECHMYFESILAASSKGFQLSCSDLCFFFLTKMIDAIRWHPKEWMH